VECDGVSFSMGSIADAGANGLGYEETSPQEERPLYDALTSVGGVDE
jgi:hypothetical protein